MKMRNGFVVLSMAIGATLSMPAPGQVSFGVSLPGVSIGVNVPIYPELVPVPGYPVYYAPNIDSNYFFYDGMYWLYQNDNWYASSWYNGPWALVSPMVYTCCESRSAITDGRRSISTPGTPMRRRTGASTGAGNGKTTTTAGIAGIERRYPRPLRCLSTSGSTRATDIRSLNSRSRWRGRIIATSRATRSFGSTIKRKRRKRRVHRLPARRLRSPRLRHAVSRSR